MLVIEGDVRRQLRFEISDTGPGIRSEDQEKIFAPFTQLPNQDLATLPGSGLGLTICRELVQLMGGDIGVTGALGSGSTFYFTVPLVAAGPGVSEACLPRATPRRSPRQRPACVCWWPKTEKTTGLYCNIILRGEPVTVQFAENGQVAVDMVVGGAEFDLILMDLDMPVLGRLRRHPEDSGMASLARHSHRRPSSRCRRTLLQELVRASLDAGCNAHLAKPVERAVLIDTIYRYTVSERCRQIAEPVTRKRPR